MANSIIKELLGLNDVIRVNETEPNNLLRQANALGDLLNLRKAAVGQVSIVQTPFSSTNPSRIIRDAIDVFSFTVERPTTFSANLKSDNESDVAMRLIRDFDGNGLTGLNELLASSNLPNADTIQFDRLEPGTYFLEVTKTTDFKRVNYELSPRVLAIAHADLIIGIERLIPLDVKSNVIVEAEVNGQKFSSPAFPPTAGQNVNLKIGADVSQREIAVKLSAFRLDANGAKIPLDLDRRAGKTALEFSYDTLTRKVNAKDGNGFFGSENQVIRQTVRGDGEGTISGIQVSYEVQAQRQPLLPGLDPVLKLPKQVRVIETLQDQEIPVVPGSRAADTLVGTAQSGILLAIGGDDQVNARGGDDIIAGGNGDDRLIGGSGDDIIIGGLGSDRILGNGGDDLLDGAQGSDQLIGGSGSDTFVLGLGNGTDVITDFENGIDFIGLKGTLTFDDLVLVQQGNRTIIRAGEQTLAELQSIAPNQLSADDFKTVGVLPMMGTGVPVVI